MFEEMVLLAVRSRGAKRHFKILWDGSAFRLSSILHFPKVRKCFVAIVESDGGFFPELVQSWGSSSKFYVRFQPSLKWIGTSKFIPPSRLSSQSFCILLQEMHFNMHLHVSVQIARCLYDSTFNN